MQEIAIKKITLVLFFMAIILIPLLVFLNCQEKIDYDDDNNNTNSSSLSSNESSSVSDTKDITAFSFIAANNPALNEDEDEDEDVDGTIIGTGIALTVPYETDETALVATFTTTGVSVKVNSTEQVSGVTENNFTNSVIYTVTAQDDSTIEDLVSDLDLPQGIALDL